MHKLEMATIRVKMDASLRYFIDLVTLVTHIQTNESRDFVC